MPNLNDIISTVVLVYLNPIVNFVKFVTGGVDHMTKVFMFHRYSIVLS